MACILHPDVLYPREQVWKKRQLLEEEQVAFP